MSESLRASVGPASSWVPVSGGAGESAQQDSAATTPALLQRGSKATKLRGPSSVPHPT